MINNEFYNDLGRRWYEADDDPVALLRAEAKVKNPWVQEVIEKNFPDQKLSILDVGCGAGFLSNFLAANGHKVTGVDLSKESLSIAKDFAKTTATYLQADAYHLPFGKDSFDVVCSMDFLEHVDKPERAIAEAARVLKPGGLFFFHTFNRNPLCHFVVIKGLEWVVKNTPKHMHVIELFIKPSELKSYCESNGLSVKDCHGIKPKFLHPAFFKMLRTGIVPKDFEFEHTRSTVFGYLGFASK